MNKTKQKENLKVGNCPRKKQVTIKDVANYAKVCHTTVSRVLHNDPRISAATKARVFEAIRILGYRPNIMARGLVKKQTYLIGLIVPDIMSSFFPEIIQGIEEIASSKGYSIILCTSENNVDRELAYVHLLLSKGVDGIILSPVYGKDILKLHPIIQLEHKPVVYLGAMLKGLKDAVFVGVDDIKIGYIATKHLIDLGYRKILHLTGPSSSLQSLRRRAGYIKAMKEHNLYEYTSLIIRSGFTIEDGYKSMQEAFSKLNFIPEAVYAVCDNAAIGALEAITEKGYNVPEDIALIGTDDLNVAPLLKVPLTSVSQPKYQMGAIAANNLIDWIEGKEVSNTILESQLVIRASCGTIKKKESLSFGVRR